ncbi:hypothetical protein LTR86_004857 [Recurvomyces mirabilis]|nr:hypothetical protein LTR86_004857 [Recurvomyces mirabilis]
MKFSLLLSFATGTTLAFPHIKDPGSMMRALEEYQDGRYKRALTSRQDALDISKAESNCGTRACPTFDAQDQLVDVYGEHIYQDPSPSDIRGPCPGLNAAANHGYLPRDGIASLEQTVSGLGALYNLGPRISAALAAYAIAVTGNPVEGVWSIGGPLPTDELAGDLLGDGQGLSYSHNNYEGDSSIGRGDAYLNHGDAHSLNITRFEEVYKIAVADGTNRYTLDKDESIANNPYYFTGLFSTVVVVPAAYSFVINLMSNHSADQPAGYLDGYNFKSFFGVTGESGSLTWLPGKERVPEDWYRRPSYAPYEAQDVVGDVAIGYLAYPNTLKFGGNTGAVNTFTGVNVANLSGGVYSADNLFQGNNFGCFAFSLLEQGVPNLLSKPLNQLAPVTDLLNKYIGPILGGLSCPQQGNYSFGVFDHFPGYKYSPTGPDTNY